MKRVFASACLLGLLAGTPVCGQDVPADSAPAPAAGDVLQQVAIGESDTRITVPVSIAGAGPYPFVIDTGAERTVISRQLADTLALPAGPIVALTAMSGTSLVPTVVIPHLQVSEFASSRLVEAPALQAEHLGAPGLLGLDTLRAHAVAIDFETSSMQVQPSRRRAVREGRHGDEIVIRGKSLLGQLIVTDAYYGNVPIRVIIDTGSPVSIGNTALLNRVRRRAGPLIPLDMTSVTGGTLTVNYTQVAEIRVGEATFQWLPVAFADPPPFRRFGLDKRPALLLGMDALRLFRRVRIDFPNREVRFLLPRPDRLARTQGRGRGAANL